MKITLQQQALGVFLAEATHGRRFLNDAKVLAVKLAESTDPAPDRLCKLMGVPSTTWGELAAIVLAKE